MQNKYVLELEDEVFENNDPNDSTILRRVKGFNSLVFDEEGLSRLQPLDDIIAGCVDSAYKDGFNDGHAEVIKKSDVNDAASHKSYIDGLHEMWELVKRIIIPRTYGCDNSIMSEVADIFRNDIENFQIRKIFTELTPEIVIERVKEYDKKNGVDLSNNPSFLEVMIGDQIDLGDGNVGVVFNKDDDNVYGYFYPRSASQPVPFCLGNDREFIKTGKHVDGLSILVDDMRQR